MTQMEYIRRELRDHYGQRDIDTESDDSVREILSDMIANKRLSLDAYTDLLKRATSAGTEDDKLQRAKHRAYVKSLMADGDDDYHASPECEAEQLAEVARMEERLMEKFQTQKGSNMTGSKLMQMAAETSERYRNESAEDPHIRVKGVDEAFSTRRTVLKHGRWDTPIHPVRNGSVSPDPVESLSEYEAAKLGAFFKYRAAKAGLCSMTEHDRSVLNDCLEKDKFVGYIGDRFVQTDNVKSILDDATSGGENLVPEWFDRATISFPLLHSELLPYVDIVDMPRGSTVETASVGNPTLTWGTAEGGAQTLFDTTSLIAQITATVFPVAVFLKLGRDLMSDSLPNIGSEIAMNVGQRHAAELDKVIVLGNGSSQPQGIVNANGTTDITPANPTTGAVDINDLLDLMFGVEKQYRIPSYAPRYVMSDQRYKSHRAQATGVTGDERLLHGMSVQSYQLLEAPVSIQNDTGHNTGIFGALRKYRLWRRAGFEMGFERGGDTLVRSNEVLFWGRGRYAGKVVDANAFAVCDGWPATA